MKGRVFNLFLFIEDEIIREIGGVAHEVDGTDDKKLTYLQSMIRADFPGSKRYALPEWCIVIKDGQTIPRAISYQTFVELRGTGKQAAIIDGVFDDLGAGTSPLSIVTCIVEGCVRIEGFCSPAN